MTDPKRPDLQAEVARLSRKAVPPQPMDPDEAARQEQYRINHAEMLETMRRERIWMGWTDSIPNRFQDANPSDFADQPEETRQKLTEWTQDPQGRNLLLLGPVGTGKTHAAVAAARVLYFTHERRVRFWPVVELLDQLRPGGDEDALESATNVPVLILDDLGAEKPTDWTAERLYAIVNRRWLDQRPTIATTNLPATRKTAPKGYEGQTLDEALGTRMFSRMVGSGAVIVRLSGPDRRR